MRICSRPWATRIHGIDVDFADGHRSGLAEHILRNADGVRHLAAILVDDLDQILRDRRSAVQNNRETGQAAADLLENIEAQLRLLAGFKFVCAVTGADGNGKRIDAGLGDELLNFAGICELRVVGVDVDIVFDAGQLAKLGLHHDAVRMGVFDNLARLGELSSKLRADPSIITDVKPPSMQVLQISKSAPWSRCSAIGISVSATAASTSLTR